MRCHFTRFGPATVITSRLIQINLRMCMVCGVCSTIFSASTGHMAIHIATNIEHDVTDIHLFSCRSNVCCSVCNVHMRRENRELSNYRCLGSKNIVYVMFLFFKLSKWLINLSVRWDRGAFVITFHVICEENADKFVFSMLEFCIKTTLIFSWNNNKFKQQTNK